ncbi:MAG: oligosaccharide flippase family protein [Bacteroidia bacterium]|nr:oligosaccharide flippase family protein [Bacteroidia bacterium]MDW8236423.1 oligosaccharide flippase family protein [Bacteroidia bacterium]
MSSFRRDILLVLLTNLISKPLWLITDNLVQNQVGHATYGLIGALLAIGQWAWVFSDWGLYALVVREVAKAQPSSLSVGSTAFTLKLSLSVAAILLFAGIGWWIGYRAESFLWLLAAIGYQMGLGYIQFFRSFFQGDQRFRVEAILSALDKIFILIGLLLLWRILNGRVYLATLMMGSLLAALAAGAWVQQSYGQLRLHFSLTQMRAIFLQSTSFALLIQVSSLSERMNQVLLERLAGAHENGLYWGAYRWHSAALVYSWTVLPLFFARFARLRSQNTSELPTTFITGLLLNSLPLIGVAGLFIAAPELFTLLFTQSTSQEIERIQRVLRILGLALASHAMFEVFSTYITSTGREKAVLRLMVIAIFLNALWGSLGVTFAQERGAAWALVAHYLFCGIGYVWIFHRLEDFKAPLLLLAKLWAFFLSYSGILWGITQYFSLTLPTKLAVAVLLWLSLAYLFGLLQQLYYASRFR